MKIAICIVGNPRAFKRTFESFKINILEPTNGDIFIHTYNNKKPDRPDVKTDGSANEYIDLYKPKKSKIDELDCDFGHLQTMAPYFKSCYESIQLMKKHEEESGIKYDVIIKTRADMIYKNKIDLIYLSKASTLENTLFIRHICDLHNYYYKDENGINDCFLAGKKFIEENVEHFNPSLFENPLTYLPSDYFFFGHRNAMIIANEEPHNNINLLEKYQPGGERLLSYIVSKYKLNYSLFINYFDTYSIR